MWIDNPDYNVYSMKVTSFANVYGNESYTEYHGCFDVMGSNVTYDVTHLYDRIHPSICEVYFQVSNPKDWHSEAIDSHYDVTFENTYYLTNTIVFSGRIRRTLVGYFLLSRYPGVGLIQESEVKEALTNIVASITNSLQDLNIERDESTVRKIPTQPDYTNATHIVSTPVKREDILKVKETETKEIKSVAIESNIDLGEHNEHLQDYTSSIYPVENIGYMQWDSVNDRRKNNEQVRFRREILDLFQSSGSGETTTATDSPTTAESTTAEMGSGETTTETETTAEPTTPGSDNTTSLPLNETTTIETTAEPTTPGSTNTTSLPLNETTTIETTAEPTTPGSANTTSLPLNETTTIVEVTTPRPVVTTTPVEVTTPKPVVTTTPASCLSTCDGCDGPCIRPAPAEDCVCQCINGYIPKATSALGCQPVVCVEETLPYPFDNSTNVTFPATQAGFTAISNNKCPVNSSNVGKPYGNRRCYLNGTWATPIWLTSCSVTLENIWNEVRGDPIQSDEQRQQVANDLEVITSVSADLTTTDVTQTSEALTEIVNTTTLTPETSNSVVATVGNLLEVPEDQLQESGQSQEILATLDSVGEKVEVDEGGEYTEVSGSVAIAVVQPTEQDAALGIGYGVTPLSIQNQVGFRSDQLSTYLAAPNTTMNSFITIPRSAISDLADRRISFVAFPDDKLFRSNSSSTFTVFNNVTVNSDAVLSATVVNANGPLSNLVPPVQLGFGTTAGLIAGRSVCVYWDEVTLTWSDVGSVITNSSNTSVTCTFNHLTNFATLFLPGDDTSISNSHVLDILTVVGCSISGASCLLLILIFIFVPKTRLKGRKKGAILLANLATAILLLDIFLIVSEQEIVTSSMTSCLAVSVLTYFSMMSVFTWMMVEGFSIASIIIYPFKTRGKLFGNWFMIASCLWGWLLPALVIMFTTIFNIDMYKRTDGECYIQPGLVLYAVLIPAAIALGVNLVLYVFLTYKVTCAKRPNFMAGKAKGLQRNLLFSLTLFVTLGLTWIFGFVIIPGNGDASFAFSVLFTVFNSLQGFFLFLLYVVRQKFTRSAISEQARRISTYAIPTTRTTQSSRPSARHVSSSTSFHENDAFEEEIENWRSESSVVQGAR
ncbi:adhesion G-protein coupled receptor G7-like [Ciona intestinalis]